MVLLLLILLSRSVAQCVHVTVAELPIVTVVTPYCFVVCFGVLTYHLI
jgi:hypothetical protein